MTIAVVVVIDTICSKTGESGMAVCVCVCVSGCEHTGTLTLNTQGRRLRNSVVMIESRIVNIVEILRLYLCIQDHPTHSLGFPRILV